jgi:hypothetical protein
VVVVLARRDGLVPQVEIVLDGLGIRATARRRPAFPVLRDGPRLRTARVLSLVLLGLMVAQSVVGLAVEGLYPEDAWAVAALRGNDLVTLALVVPALALAVWRSSSHPSAATVVVWLGLLFYGVYNYAYYAFGTAFSSVFLLHVAAFAVSTYALVLLGSSVEARGVAVAVRHGAVARVVAAFTMLVGLALVVAWGTLSVRFAVTGELPQDVMPPSAVHLVYALDLGVLAPMFVVSGVLLWLGRPWGAVLAPAVNVSGAAYLAVLELVGGFQAQAGVAGATWASLPAVGGAVLCLGAALALLVPRRRVSGSTASARA